MTADEFVDAYSKDPAKFIAEWCGDTVHIYIPHCQRDKRDHMIRDLFQTCDVPELARRFKMSERQVRRIINNNENTVDTHGENDI